MRRVTHRFQTASEASAFVVGVEWVNDSAITVLDIQTGPDYADVILQDNDDDYDALYSYTDNGDGTHSQDFKETYP